MPGESAVKVGYYDPFGIWPRLQEQVTTKLPFQNFHVRLDPRQTLKTISQLEVGFEEEVPKKGEYHAFQDDRINSSTYVRMMFVTIEDMDKYRGQVRPLIREWLKNLVFKTHNLSWMIVLYIPPDSKDRNSSLIKTSFFDKLKIDFGPQGKQLHTILPGAEEILKIPGERCFKLKANANEGNELLNQVKILLGSSFSGRFIRYNELISQTGSKGKTQLLARLELGYLFQDMKLLQDALNTNESLLQDLKLLIAQRRPETFDYKVTLPDSLDDFEFEQLVDKTNSEEQLLSAGAVNLFQLRCLFFHIESNILMAIAEEAMKKSLFPTASREISRLFQRVMMFLSEIEAEFTRSCELEYVVTKYFLELPTPVGKLLELFESNLNSTQETKEESVQMPDLMEMVAELKLFQKSVVSKLARSRGIEIEGLDVVVLEDIDLNQETPDPPAARLETIPLTNGSLMAILKDKSTYMDYFETTTEEAIEYLVKCNRDRTIDILSLDLAMVNYARGNYRECIASLSYEYFTSNGWSLIGGVLLDVYLKCIEKLEPENKKEILDASVVLLSRTKSLAILQDKSRIEKLYKTIVETRGDNLQKLSYPLDKIFDNVMVDSFVYPDLDVDEDKYIIKITLVNPFAIPITLSHVALTLQDKSEGSSVVFSCSNLQLKESKGKQDFQLSTNGIKFGVFACHELEVSLGEHLLLQRVYKSETTKVNTPLVNQKHIGPGDLLIHQSVEKLQARFIRASSRTLKENHPILQITNGNNCIKKLKITLTSHHINNNNTQIRFNEPELEVNELSPGETRQITTPCTVSPEAKEAHLQATGTYEIGGEEFSFQISNGIDISLSIAVSVQDVFKPKFLYSRFHVSSVNPHIPIKLISHSLESSSYNIRGGIQMPGVIASGEQPASLVYRIEPRARTQEAVDSVLKLTINYKNVELETQRAFVNYLKDLFEKHNKDMLKYWYVCEDYLLPHAKFNLDKYITSGELEITNSKKFLDDGRKLLARYVDGSSDRNTLLDLVSTFFGSDQSKHHEAASKDDQFVETLIIDVAVPQLQFLHSVEFHCSRKLVVVGEPIPVKITVDTTTKWAAASTQVGAISENGHQVVGKDRDARKSAKFKLEIIQSAEYLISGLTSHVFDVPYLDSSFDLDVIIIPLTVGKWKYPRVVIKAVEAGPVDDLSFSDVYLVNSGELLTVVPFTNEITFTF
ncbi:uncharacterized protein LODBEIA_P40300 [Lodderomyces beijingensis]|uniref:Trafficking protein particle complex subunit 11 domain-containing protein n=1 Tax=Lodderomyces beijingensis TaxID=1775926 RepID=A0ABP0ZNR8_9ASCO